MTDQIFTADSIEPRRLAWGRRAVAKYLGQNDSWLARQLERAKAPPPVFRVGSAIVAVYPNSTNGSNAGVRARQAEADKRKGRLAGRPHRCCVMEENGGYI
jgi:hypothetical protein